MVNIENLHFAYGQKEVLRGVSLELSTGRIYGILGMNGSGKTTLFNILYQRLRPEAGRCQWNGADLRPDHIAFLETQNYFYPYLKGREYLELIAHAHPAFSVEKWNELFELPLEDLIDGYSTGMKKKLAFLGVLALDRPVLLLDEPFNGVDIESNEKLYQILLGLREKGKLIILSSHIIESLTRISDEIHFLQNGQIEQQYLRADFPSLEEKLRKQIGEKIQQKLGNLL